MKDYVDMIATIRNEFGDERQAYKVMEELKELSDAIEDSIPLLGNDKGIITARESIIEEIGDVEIMLAQLKMIFNISDAEVTDAKIGKLHRTLKRIDTGFYAELRSNESR